MSRQLIYMESNLMMALQLNIQAEDTGDEYTTSAKKQCLQTSASNLNNMTDENMCYCSFVCRLQMAVATSAMLFAGSTVRLPSSIPRQPCLHDHDIR